MQLIFCDTNKETVDALRDQFGDEADYFYGSFADSDGADVIVSAANSFGIMDGGIDLALSEYFGWELEQRVQKHIVKHYLTHQPVGTAFIISVEDDRFSYLCHAPTMRIPRNIEGTENIYQAMAAILRVCHRERIESVMMCGLGTGAGGVDSEVAAEQMYLAWQHYRMRSKNIDWDRARQMDIEITRASKE